MSSDGHNLTIEFESKTFWYQSQMDVRGKSNGVKFKINPKRIVDIPTKSEMYIDTSAGRYITFDGGTASVAAIYDEEEMTHIHDDFFWSECMMDEDFAKKVSRIPNTRESTIMVHDGILYAAGDSYLIGANSKTDLDDLELPQAAIYLLSKNKPTHWARTDNAVIFKGDDFAFVFDAKEPEKDPEHIVNGMYTTNGELNLPEVRERLEIFEKDVFMSLTKNASISASDCYSELGYKGTPIMFNMSTEHIEKFIKKSTGKVLKISRTSSRTRPILRLESDTLIGYFSHRRM